MKDKNRYEDPKLVPMNPESSELPEEDLSRVTGGDESEQSCHTGLNPLSHCSMGGNAGGGTCASGGVPEVDRCMMGECPKG